MTLFAVVSSSGTSRSRPYKSFVLFALFLLLNIAVSFPLSSSISTSFTRRDLLEGVPLVVVAMSPSSSSSLAAADSKATNNIVRWGIVGLGDVCQKKSGPAFYKCQGSELAAVMRRTPGKAVEFASHVPAPKAGGGKNKCVGYDNLEAFLQHPGGLDAVYVSTRPGAQLEICKKVAAAGKACYVEKPVGRCAAETEQIHKVFADAKLPLYTAYISRAYDRTQAVRKLLSEGFIGDRLTKVSYKLIGTGGARDMDRALPWRLDASQSGGGLIMDVGCHIMDRIDYLCGPLIKVKGTAENRNSPQQPVEDYVHLTADVGKGSWAAMPHCDSASVECTWDFASSEAARDELEFVGNQGSIRMAGMLPDGPVQVCDASGNLVQELKFEMPEHTAQKLIQAVTDDLRGLEKANYLSHGDNAIRTSKVLDSTLDSYYGGREIGYWSRVEEWPGHLAALSKTSK